MRSNHSLRQLKVNRTPTTWLPLAYLFWGLVEATFLALFVLDNRAFGFSMPGITEINLVVVLVLAVVILLFPNDRFALRWAKYDAENILANFSSIARQQVDLDELSVELAYVAQATMQSEHLALWICSIYSVTPLVVLDVKEHTNG